MSNATLTHYAQAANEVADTWIGELCWYSLHDVAVPHELFVEALAGLPNLEIPARPADHDVFRRACSKQKANRVPGEKEDEFFNYMMREFADDTQIVRRVVRETVNPKGKRLRYEEMIDVSFRRATDTHPEPGVRIKSIPGANPDGTAQELATAAVAEYRAKRGTLNAQGVREWMRKYLVDAGAISVRPSGGLYFIPQEKADMLEVLDVLATAVNESVAAGTIDYHSLPLIDSKKQRQMIRRAFDADTTSVIDSKMVEITELLRRGKKISEGKYASILGEYQRLASRSKEYQDLLDHALEDTGTRLSWFQAQILTLSDLVDYGDDS